MALKANDLYNKAFELFERIARKRSDLVLNGIERMTLDIGDKGCLIDLYDDGKIEFDIMPWRSVVTIQPGGKIGALSYADATSEEEMVPIECDEDLLHKMAAIVDGYDPVAFAKA